MIEEEKVRRERLNLLQTSGVNPYPARVKQTHTIKNYHTEFDELLKNGTVSTIVGRAKTIRKHGGLTFVNCDDGTSAIQLVIRRDNVGEDQYKMFHEVSDMGDFFEVTGKAFVTKKGEKSLDVQVYKIITKTLLPMPEKWHGLSDIEIRYRKRELDLLANEDVKQIFRIRAKIISTMRAYLDNADFLEVETPILQAVPGGASAKPFVTHHNALDSDMYLRIAPELYLKRCVVGGLNRVYEVARCFRNEGIDHAHNPEFTQIEGYAAYMDYEQLMTFLEGMLIEVIKACGLEVSAVPYNDHILDFTAPFKRITFRSAVLSYAKIDIEDYPERNDLAKAVIKLGVPVEKTDSKMSILDNLYKHLVRPKIIQPHFFIDYPSEITPLAKKKHEDPRYAEMFQLVYGGGVENIKAFSELNDPLDQESRFKEQEDARKQGDEEAQFGDDEFVEALKHGMPPTAGFGIGIDRLTATLTNSPNLKEVILFPTLRPE